MRDDDEAGFGDWGSFHEQLMNDGEVVLTIDWDGEIGPGTWALSRLKRVYYLWNTDDPSTLKMGTRFRECARDVLIEYVNMFTYAISCHGHTARQVVNLIDLGRVEDGQVIYINGERWVCDGPGMVPRPDLDETARDEEE
jgi:hypothetical protein